MGRDPGGGESIRRGGSKVSPGDMEPALGVVYRSYSFNHLYRTSLMGRDPGGGGPSGEKGPRVSPGDMEPALGVVHRSYSFNYLNRISFMGRDPGGGGSIRWGGREGQPRALNKCSLVYKC